TPIFAPRFSEVISRAFSLSRMTFNSCLNTCSALSFGEMEVVAAAVMGRASLACCTGCGVAQADAASMQIMANAWLRNSGGKGICRWTGGGWRDDRLLASRLLQRTGILR